MSNSYSLARQRWEQKQFHGCKHANGVCTLHRSTRTDASEPPSGLICTCRAFSYQHDPKFHDGLPGRFAGDTEWKRFEDAAATDWRTQEERDAGPTGEAESAKEQAEQSDTLWKRTR
jgi:hypothetical protein